MKYFYRMESGEGFGKLIRSTRTESTIRMFPDGSSFLTVFFENGTKAVRWYDKAETDALKECVINHRNNAKEAWHVYDFRKIEFVKIYSAYVAEVDVYNACEHLKVEY